MQAIPRELVENSWIVLLFLLGFILLFLMKVIQSSRLLGYSISFFTKGYFEKRAEEKPVFFSAFHGFLFSFTALVLSVFLYATSVHLNSETSFYTFLYILLFVTIYLMVRYLTDFLLSKLLGVFEYVRYFVFSKTGYLYSVAIWLFPILIFYFYGNKNYIFLLVSFLILLLLRFGLVLYNNKKLILRHFLYFILYLCALEIAPLFILIKILKLV